MQEPDKICFDSIRRNDQVTLDYINIYHFDEYILKNSEELYNLGFCIRFYLSSEELTIQVTNKSKVWKKSEIMGAICERLKSILGESCEDLDIHGIKWNMNKNYWNIIVSS